MRTRSFVEAPEARRDTAERPPPPSVPPMVTVRPASAWNDRLVVGSVDLAASVGIGVLAATAVWLEWSPPLRVAFAVPFIMFLPGYAFVAALFPRHAALDGVERIALGFGLSLALVAPIALGLDLTPWPIGTTSIVVALLAVQLGFATVAIKRRHAIPVSDRYSVPLPVVLQRSRFSPWGMTWMSGLVGIVTVSLLVGGALLVAQERRAGDPLTEFALLSDTGRAQQYAREVVIGQPSRVVVEITNREGVPVTYLLAIGGAGAAVDPIDTITVNDGETWSETIRYTVTKVGERLPVEITLWRLDQPDERTRPYRMLRLMVEGRLP